MTTIADGMIRTLSDNGVRRVYGLPGDSLNGFTDALRRNGSISWVHVRHEESAAFAAAGEAAVTGELAVCAGSCGPGNLHLINGLFDAQRSRVPVLAIAAHIPRAEIGSQYFQETHPQELFRECSVFCELVSSAADLPRIVEMAMRAAIEENGVAVVVVPGEIFLEHAKSRDPYPPIVAARPVVRPSDVELESMATMLNGSKRITILAGAGCAGAHDELVRVAETLAAPIVHSLRGKEYVEYDNPFDVGMTGLLGFRSGFLAMERAEVLLMLGTDFPYTQFFSEHATVIQVDTRGRNLGRRTRVDLGLVGTVVDTLQALLPRLDRHLDDHHLNDALEHYRRTRDSFDALATDNRDHRPIKPEFVAASISRLAETDAAFTLDVGTPVVWGARYLRMNGRRRLIGSFNHGSMACALPLAIGIQAASPDRQVIALAGDGGLAMLLGELLTLRQNNLPVKVVIFNNASLGFVELEMKAAGVVNFGTELDNPDFAAVATAIGLFGIRVENPDDLDDALTRAFDHDGPAVIDVVTARQELSLPPTITADQATGFTLWGIRTVLAEGPHELVDLVNENVVDRIRRPKS